MENRITHLRRLLDREFRHEKYQQEQANCLSPVPSEEGISEWEVFPSVRRFFLLGLFPERGDDNVG